MSTSGLSVLMCMPMYRSSPSVLMPMLMPVSIYDLFMSLSTSISLSTPVPLFIFMYFPLAAVLGIHLLISIKVSMVRDFVLFLTASLGFQR